MTILVGLAYPLAVTGVAQLAFGDKADGSLIVRHGRAVGSRLIGQEFEGEHWFQPRPSAAGDGYDAGASAASNLGPTNEDFLATVRDRSVAFRHANGMAAGEPVPVDAVTASASGLDPDISVANARLQAARVARARRLDRAQVLNLVERHTDGRALGFLGEPGVNVVELNLALDSLR